MLNMITQLFGWMPPVLSVVCICVVSIFVILTLMKLVKLILDVIPFL